MARQIRDLTNTTLDDVPRPCRGCVFWEYAPADRALTLGAHDADFEKEADVFPLRISRDALFLAMVRILPDAAGRGVGKALVHSVLKEAKARGKRAVECYGDRGWQHEACIVPAAFLEAIGFRVKREHPRFPLYRIDLGSLAKASKNVEAAVEAFLENLFNNEPAVGKAPARSNAGR